MNTKITKTVVLTSVAVFCGMCAAENMVAELAAEAAVRPAENTMAEQKVAAPAASAEQTAETVSVPAENVAGKIENTMAENSQAAQPVAGEQMAGGDETDEVSTELKKTGREGDENTAAESSGAGKAPVVTCIETGTDKKGTGKVELVDLACEEAPLSEILLQFRKATGANIVSAASSNLERRVSLTLNRVPWLDALQAVLNVHNFRLEPRGEIYFVSEDFEAEPKFTRTFTLNHASATELAELFNTTLGGVVPGEKKPGGPRPIATAFEGANVVVVTAKEKVLSDCERIIAAVDRAVPQIYIEARFIEVSNEAMHKLGLQWNQLESWGATAKGLTAGWEYNNARAARYRTGKTIEYNKTIGTRDDGTPITGNVKVENFNVPGGIEEAAGAGRAAADMLWRNARGFSGQLSADDFHLAMSAFEEMDDVKVFSNPKIIVSNGKEAKVDMTTKFPNVRVQASRNTSNGSDSLDISTQLEAIPGEDKLMFAKEVFFSWGITLMVKPRISPDGLISVEIVPTISQLDTDVSPTGFYEVKGGDSSAYSSYPIISVKRLTTDFTMKDGATAVIGGLSKTSEQDIDSGIPYLRHIPWIGPKLFGWKSRGKVQKEIIVFVTLGLADPADLPQDVGLPKNAVVGREYVKGRKTEPGDRADASAATLKLDIRPMEEKNADAAAK